MQLHHHKSTAQPCISVTLDSILYLRRISICMSSREIIQRVADVMIIYGFFHVADATAVRGIAAQTNFMSLLSRTVQTWLWHTQKTWPSLCLISTVCDGGCYQRSRKADDGCSGQPGGILLHWFPHRCVPDVRSQYGNFRWEQIHYFHQLQLCNPVWC